MQLSGFGSNLPQAQQGAQQSMLVQKQLEEQRKARQQGLWLDIAKMILGQGPGGGGIGGIGQLGQAIGSIGKIFKPF